MPTWLVTGGSGFLGRHLLATLSQEPQADTRIIALGRRLPGGLPPDQFERVDLNDAPALDVVIERLAPDVVFHLAGMTASPDPARLFQTNVGGTARLVASLKRLRRPARLVLAGSAAELGPVPVEHLPAGETCPCRPWGPYGLSKWFAAAHALHCGGLLEVVVARIFNPIGPGAPPSQVFGRLATELATARSDLVPIPLVVRDLDAKRDFVDVRDVAAALIALAARGHPGAVYHVGSGQSRSVREGLDYLLELGGRKVRLVHQNTNQRGPVDSRADTTRIIDHTGWEPQIAWGRSLSDLWSEVVSRPISRPVAVA